MQATINGIRMNYDVSGAESAPPVVLHHPLATNLTHLGRADGGAGAAAIAWCASMRAATARPRRPKAPYTSRRWRPTWSALMDHLKIDARAFPRPVDGRHGRPVPRAAACRALREPAAGLDQQPRSADEAKHLWVRAREGRAREGHGIAGGAGDAALDHRGEPQEAGAGGAPVQDDRDDAAGRLMRLVRVPFAALERHRPAEGASRCRRA